MVQNFSIATGVNTVINAITDRVWGFLRKGGSIIGIDIGSSAIKIVQLKNKEGKAVLETYGELALGPYADLAIGQAVGLSVEKIGEALRDIIREANITSHDAGIAIPLASSLITVIEMPYVSEKQLKEMVPLEARKYIPVSINEVSLDWSMLPEPEKGQKDLSGEMPEIHSENSSSSEVRKKAKILLAAIHNEVLEKYKSISDGVKLDAAFFEIEVFSSIRALLGRERDIVFILDIGAGTTKLLMVEGGVIKSSHIINRGSQDITLALSKSLGVNTTKAEEVKRDIGLSEDPLHKNERDLMTLILNSIFSDANRAILEYEKKYQKPVQKVILSGGGSLLKGIEKVAQKNFDMEIVRADPFSKVETPAFLEPTLKEAGPNFAVALGVALRRLQELE